MSEHIKNEEYKLQENNNHFSRMINPEELEKSFVEMIYNGENLKNGYITLNKYELMRNFHLGVLTNIFNNLDNDIFKKLASSTFNIYVRKNWNLNYLITNEEKLVKLINFDFFLYLVSKF